MPFHKYPHPSNFEFITSDASRPFSTPHGKYRLRVESRRPDIHRLTVSGGCWRGNDSFVRLSSPARNRGERPGETALEFTPDGGMSLRDASGAELLGSLPGRFFGQNGEASIFAFKRTGLDFYYGLGEKWSGFEHSNKTARFWNTDVWGDFHSEACIHGRPDPDPVYVSIPYLIIRRGSTHVGLLLDNPRGTFISTERRSSVANQMVVSAASHGSIYLGAESGQPSLWILVGPSLAELTRKLQRLVGPTPLPPAWALGYHQCRWGYRSEADLLELDRKFRQHGIPADGLWLDIDYMRGYRIFTFAKEHFPKPKAALAELARRGRKVVPIIDPGVKREEGFSIFDDGNRAKAFCRNPQRGNYVGLVWPGETVFPDFSMDTARRWWAGHTRSFAAQGFQGAWLDMNDPATGVSSYADMLFGNGRRKHDVFHNQYALGMAAATRDGFLQAWPGKRPFLLCRSGSTGISRYTAIWTGDNYSNYHHLRRSISTTLNLALSGVPFNGPDIGGFGGDTTAELLRDWIKAGFLFPVCRNHSAIETRQQEPWAFDRATLDVARHFIRLRYRFRPYLYQLFAEHERTGEAILRPLFYDFASSTECPLEHVDDQFLVGPSVMQAPFVTERAASRKVIFPEGATWFDVFAGKWRKGNRHVTVKAEPGSTPLYIRDGAILPLARLRKEEHLFEGRKVDFHVFLAEARKSEAQYVFDDGETFDYQKGSRSEVRIEASRRGRRLDVGVHYLSEGYGKGEFAFTAEAKFTEVFINGERATACAAQGVPLAPGLRTWRARKWPVPLA